MFKNVKLATKENAPTLLSGLGILSLFSTAVMATRGTIKAVDILKKEEEELSKKEVVKRVWPCYIPTAISIGVGIVGITQAHRIHVDRYSALLTAATLAEKTYDKFEEFDHDLKKEEVVEKKEDLNPSGEPDESCGGLINEEPILCYETASKTYFRSTLTDVHTAELNLNQRFVYHGVESLASFFDELGVRYNPIAKELGWNARDMVGDYIFIPIRHNSGLSENGQPCLVIDFRYSPREGFEDEYDI